MTIRGLSLSLLLLVGCGGGFAPATLTGKAVRAVETEATGSQLPVGTSLIVIKTATSATLDGDPVTYSYSSSGNGATLEASAAGLVVKYELTFTSASDGTYVGTTTTGAAGTSKGTFTVIAN